MGFDWVPISRPFTGADDDHDIVVVGSGYGGGVAASRLARAGGRDAPRVTVLERGREIAPGYYPDNPVDAAKDTQVTLSSDGTTTGNAQGLYDMRMGTDVNVLLGCGLGGTSLINANVALEPDPRVYDTWPAVFREDRKLLGPYFDRARAMLGSKPYPEGKTPPKLAALEKVAEGTGMHFGRPDINVSFEDDFNAAGVWQAACTDCGDCVSGCNYGAKNTVLMNYLPDAAKSGAAIYTGAEVVSLSRLHDRLNTRDGRWRLTVRDISPRKDGAPAEPPTREITADIVILAAGTLGSTEILLRSETLQGRLSKKLGAHFSGNGDVWSFGYNANIPSEAEGAERAPVYGVGAGTHEVSHGPTAPEDAPYKPGPCITGMVTLTDPLDVTKSVLVEEGVMPGALAPIYAAAFPAMDALMGDPFRFGDTKLRLEDARKLGDEIAENPLALAETAYKGPVSRTLPFLVMSHDASDGRLVLESGRVAVDWPQAGGDPALLNDEAVIRRACDAIQAEYLPNPLWQDALGRRIVTVHPLGGCAMADSPEEGVVNDRCEVFDTQGGVHPGLYVCDGAVLPRAVGVNPHLTITAVAERAVELLAEKYGWPIDWSPAPKTDRLPPLEDVLPNVVDALKQAIAALEQIEAAINGNAWELARMLLKGAWRTFREAVPNIVRWKIPATEAFIDAFREPKDLQEIIAPIVGQFLDVLRALEAELAKGDARAAWKVAEEKLGDFSPPVSFQETMVGRISTIGLDDTSEPFDPYQAAGAGPADCTFSADIHADALRAAITPPDGTGTISNGILTSESFGTFRMEAGTFRFLMPDPDRIECWEMIYEGMLEEEEGGQGRVLRFEGRKRLQFREGSHWWIDLTELRVDLTNPLGGAPVARGLLRVSLQETVRQAKGLEIEYTDLFHAAEAAYDHVADAWSDGKKTLPKAFEDRGFRANAVKTALLAADFKKYEASETIALAYKATVFARMGGLVLRAYGGLFSYMTNFPGETADSPPPPDPRLPKPEVFFPEVEPGVYLKLTRYRDGENCTKGPVVVAGGFGTRASSFALSTADSLAFALVDEGYDVWLFDYRGSGEIEASLSPFTLDDVARKDWPAAIDLILRCTGATSVQALVHCIGSMTLFMAILAGETRVRSVVASQLAAHPITNWFNFAKSDARTAGYLAYGVPEPLWGVLAALNLPPEAVRLAKEGLPFVDPRSPSGAAMRDEDGAVDLDAAIDAMLWKVPSFAPVPCLSPTCHRINFVFGPSYRHDMLNEGTHDAIRHFFGPVSTTPFIHIAKIFGEGRLVSADGQFDYMENVANLAIPVHFIAGGRNQEMLPEASLRTLDWLVDAHGGLGDTYTRTVFPEYGHMDCFIGQAAHKDIFPDLLEALKRHG